MTERMMETVAEIRQQMNNRYYGKYRGVVRNVDDRNGTIQALVPAVYGEELSPWAYPCAPFAGNQHGLVLLPEAGDGVWIEFEAGDISRPIWCGGWWGQNELPQPGAEKKRVLATTAGLKIVLDDQAKEIQLKHPDGPVLTMTGQEIKLSLQSGTELTINAAEISLKIGSAKLALSASGVSINDSALQVM